jgi:iron complex transport system ATP-binding protein
MKPVIKVDNLTFGYSSEPLLKDLSFEVEGGSFVSIVGPNGAGKTTLLNLLCSLLKPQAGRIEIDSVPIERFSARKLAQKISIVRQEFVPVFDFTAGQIVSMGRLPYSDMFGFESKKDKSLIKEAFEVTDTGRFEFRNMRSLSSGERQRIFIARAIAQDTRVLLLDEPTNFLDIKQQVNIFDLLKAAQKEKGKTIIAVTHDINLATQYADYALLIGQGGEYKFGQASEIFTKEQVEALFGIKVFAGQAGSIRFFLAQGNHVKGVK